MKEYVLINKDTITRFFYLLLAIVFLLSCLMMAYVFMKVI